MGQLSRQHLSFNSEQGGWSGLGRAAWQGQTFLPWPGTISRHSVSDEPAMKADITAEGEEDRYDMMRTRAFSLSWACWLRNSPSHSPPKQRK